MLVKNNEMTDVLDVPLRSNSFTYAKFENEAWNEGRFSSNNLNINTADQSYWKQVKIDWPMITLYVADPFYPGKMNN